MNILNYLDNQIEIFKQKNNEYPKQINMNQETKDRVFVELDKYLPIIDNCWIDFRDNFRGIYIAIKTDTFIEMEK
jgi:hypothetical protein